MAYLALYRMFRPAALDDVVRQEHIVTILKNQIETGRIGHAYLLCGPRGTGKTSVAKIVAAAINCESPVEGSPCGKCAACRALADPSNLDISEIDAASNNGVDEMRDLREKVQYPPVAGKYKVYIVDEVHMLSTGAFNALLKTLEEPPAHAVFILATTEAQKIPATILSRCMRFDFKLIPQADLELRLKAILDKIGKPYDDEAVAAIARAGAGSVRDMLSVADTCVSYSAGRLTYEAVTAVLGSADFSQMRALCAAMLNGERGEALERTEEILAEGKSVGVLLKDVMNFLNACAVAKTCRDAEKILALPADTFSQLAETAKAADGHRLLRVTEIFADTENALRYSVSPRIVFETDVMKASLPQADYNIDSLIARVNELERKLDEGVFSAPKASAAGGAAEKDDAGAEIAEERGRGETTKAEKPAAHPSESTKREAEAYDDYEPPAFDEVPPPDEEATGGNVYFDSAFELKDTSERKAPTVRSPRRAAETPREDPVLPARAATPAKAPVSAPEKPTVRASAVPGDAKATFGSFLRALRKVGRNGVLFTICMDLDSAYEGSAFVLYTESETIYRSLTKEDHYSLIKQALEAIGIADFEVRLRGKKGDEFNRSLSELKEKFPDVKIDIK